MKARACSLDDLADACATRVEVSGRPLAIVRIGENVHAFYDACPHKGAPLSQGTVSVKRGELICPWHRFRFDVATGVSVTCESSRARTFPVEISDGEVFVDIGPGS